MLSRLLNGEHSRTSFWKVNLLLVTRDHVNVFIYDPIAPDPKGIINQGQENATARAIQVYREQPVDKQALVELFMAVIANNRAGGWRKLNK